jgi:hypothetical protein
MHVDGKRSVQYAIIAAPKFDGHAMGLLNDQKASYTLFTDMKCTDTFS